MCEEYHMLYLSSDALRMAMFDTPTFSREENALVFRTMRHVTERALASGHSVVYDANNARYVFRAELYALADTHHARPVLVHVQTPEDVALDRVLARHHHPDPRQRAYYQTLKPEQFYAMRDEIEPPRDHEPVVRFTGMLPYHEQKAVVLNFLGS